MHEPRRDVVSQGDPVVVHDAAYAALVFEGKPLSFLATPGAMDVGVELHSMSKGFNMTGWRLGFVVGMAAQIVISVAGDKATYKPGVLRKSLRNLRRSPLLTRDLWDQLKEYDRPNFHPDDRDTDGLVEEWREKLFGADGTLNDKLVKPAA